MIIITKPGISDAELDHIRERVESLGMRTHISRGEQRTIIGCIGDEALLQEISLLSLPGVESVVPVLRPHKLASREFASGEKTVVAIGDAQDTCIGARELVVIAGPCSVEGRDMLFETARAIRAHGARMLRGGAFKPRTSPYAFQGLGTDALTMLAEVRAQTQLPVVTEVMDPRQVELVAEHVDMLQIGARNMQNFPLLSEVGRVNRPVLLKRGLSATLGEFLMAAEYIMLQGNRSVVLCERGIRTFETATRNTLDVAAIPVLKSETHLPVLVDPSHAGGKASLVAPLAFAAIAAGADGLIIEVHPCPEQALSDGDQSLTPGAFADLMARLRPFAEAADRTLAAPNETPEAATLRAPRRASPAAGWVPDDALSGPREEIERLDRALIQLIAERMTWARSAGAIKRAAGLTLMDPAREAAVVRHAGSLARDSGLPDDDVRAIFWHLISLSRRAQIEAGVSTEVQNAP